MYSSARPKLKIIFPWIKVLLASYLGILLIVDAQIQARGKIQIANPQGSQTAIVITSGADPGVIAAARQLQEYIWRVTKNRPSLWTDSEVRLEDLDQPSVILAGRTPSSRWPREILQKVAAPTGAESFTLQTLEHRNQDFVVVRGADLAGIRYGLFSLLRELAVDPDGEVTVARLRTTQAPAVRNRILGLFWNGGLPKEEARMKNPENWSLDRLHQYLELMDSLGFNGLQTWDNLAGNYRGSDYSFTRSEWRNKLIHLLSWNHLRGWKNLLFVWANTILDPLTRDSRTIRDLTIEEDVRLLGGYYDYQASLAPYLDYFVSHNQDPGGGRNFGDVQTLHLMLRTRFLKNNPQVRPAFSYWYLFDPADWWGWRGPMEEGARKLLAMAMMPLDSVQVVGVHGGRPETWEQTEILKAFSEQGYPTGIWAWYWADFEYQPGLHVHTSRLEDYFESLSPGVAKHLDFHTVDSHNHEMNLPSLYVAAQKLWDPTVEAGKLLREYCEAVYGPNVGPTISEALLEVGRIRCSSPFFPGFCGAGTKEPDRDLGSARQWQETLAQLIPDPQWVPKLRILRPLSSQIEDIRRAFREIRDYAQFRLALEEARAAIRKTSVSRQEVRRIVEELPEISRYTVEYQPWQRDVRELERAIAHREAVREEDR